MSDSILMPSLIIEANDMQAANETQSFNLAVPDSGVKKGRNKHGETWQWTEILNVVGSEIGLTDPTDDAPARVFIDVKFLVAPETFDPKNNGRTYRTRYLINPDQLGVKGSKERTMSLMSIGRLNNLLRAAGFEIEEGVATDLGAYFQPNGNGESQVSGMKVAADFKNYTDKNGVKRQDIVAFDSPEA